MTEDNWQHFPIDRSRLPASWGKAYIGDIATDIQPGFASGEHNQEGDGLPHIRPMNISRLGTIDLVEVKFVAGQNPARLAEGDVLFNNTNSPVLVGKTAPIRSTENWAFSNHMTRIRLNAGIDYRFLAAELHYLWMAGYFRHRCVNHVNQASISSKTLASSVPIVIPPLNEQRRIVAKIEELFSDLDAGVAALERIRANLKRYRAAVLKAAVEGKLSQAWRAKHPHSEPATKLLERILTERRQKWEENQLAKFAAAGKTPPKGWREKYIEPAAPDTNGLRELPQGWCWARIEQLLTRSEYGTSVKCDYGAIGPPVLRIPNIAKGQIDLDDMKQATVQIGLTREDALQKGDLLMCRTNGSINLIGKAALVRGNYEPFHTFASYLLRFRFREHNTLPKWVHLFLTSSHGRLFIEKNAASSAGQHNISLSLIHTMLLPLPPLAEQSEIAQEVESRLSIIEETEAQINANLKRAARLRQSILKRAFEGKLVPQDPSDEPAEKLLERIRSARETASRRARETASGNAMNRKPRQPNKKK